MYRSVLIATLFAAMSPFSVAQSPAQVKAATGPSEFTIGGAVTTPMTVTMEDLKKMDLPRLRVGQRDQAVQDVKSSLLLERVADLEKIEVGEDEVNHEIEALAKQSKQTSEAVRARLTQDGGLDRIRNRIRSEKTLDFLYRQSA